MRANIHPNWNPQATITCACGHIFTTGSTQDAVRVDICSKCHPLFTGQQKFIDTLGQVDKFQKKTQEAAKKFEVKKLILQNRAQKSQSPKDKPSLKDLLMQARKSSSS